MDSHYKSSWSLWLVNFDPRLPMPEDKPRIFWFWFILSFNSSALNTSATWPSPINFAVIQSIQYAPIWWTSSHLVQYSSLDSLDAAQLGSLLQLILNGPQPLALIVVVEPLREVVHVDGLQRGRDLFHGGGQEQVVAHCQGSVQIEHWKSPFISPLQW